LKVAALDRTVAKLNVEHYRRLLATETDEARRQVLLTLLAEEESKLAQVQAEAGAKADAKSETKPETAPNAQPPKPLAS
jgi:hypothetical protein